ncbi:uncharacterized protein LOC125529653 [Triticum urartu]|uniref:uncharacterized protein LOC125529653 n=1 Tax=Triticum urartu TaxID=4572 RepID=UPI002044649B|nr:uncharacterized protein LOC125529653 [Triticum urartu]
MGPDVLQSPQEGLTVPKQGDGVRAPPAIGNGLKICRIGVPLEDPILCAPQTPVGLLIRRLASRAQPAAQGCQEVAPPVLVRAGTQFWDAKMEKELGEGHLSSTAFDRYCMILFAGIAAEALVYGEAEGGENDENLFRSLCVLLDPPLSVAQMANRARWSVMQSYNLLKWHKKAHRAAVKALESGHGLSIVIRRIEEAIASDR